MKFLWISTVFQRYSVALCPRCFLSPSSLSTGQTLLRWPSQLRGEQTCMSLWKERNIQKSERRIPLEQVLSVSLSKLRNTLGMCLSAILMFICRKTPAGWAPWPWLPSPSQQWSPTSSSLRLGWVFMFTENKRILSSARDLIFFSWHRESSPTQQSLALCRLVHLTTLTTSLCPQLWEGILTIARWIRNDKKPSI